MEMLELTEADLEVELLPERRELQNIGVGIIAVGASNTSVALNAGTILSFAGSLAIQTVSVG